MRKRARGMLGEMGLMGMGRFRGRSGQMNGKVRGV